MLDKGQMQAGAGQASDERLIDLDRLWAILLRQARVIACCLAVGLAMGLVYLVLSPPSYTASSEILIDRNLEEVVGEVTPPNRAVDLESEILNQIEVLRSSRLAGVVAEVEKLNIDKDFLNPPPSALGRLRGLLFGSGSDAPLAEAPLDTAAAMLLSGVVVERIGRSSVVRVEYESHSPELAYRITRAYANAFVRDRLNANIEATREAADWLQQRLAELGQAQRQASMEVERYRTEAGLSTAQDRTLSGQRLEALTGQLVLAQAETARIRALSDQLQKVVDAGPVSAAANADLLTDPGANDPALAALKTRHAALQRRISEISATYGPGHPQIEVLKRELASLSDQLFAQLRILAEHYRNELTVAEAHEAGLRQDVENEGSRAAETSQSQVELNTLQQRSAALDALYNSFLGRYEESVQRQSFPIPTLRVITEASLPERASGPRTSVVLMGGVLFGGLLGLAAAAVNEMRERGFRVGNQVMRETGLRFAGYLPKVDINGPKTPAGAARLAIGRFAQRMRRRSMLGMLIEAGRMARSVLRSQVRLPPPATTAEQVPPEVVHRAIRGQIAGRLAASPTTAFLETLKMGRVLLRSRRPNEGAVVGVVSILPGEGKTTYSVALAEALAAGGSRTLLIDADLRRATASRLLNSHSTPVEINLAAGAPWRHLVRRDPDTGLSVLPAGAIASQTTHSDILTKPAMPLMLKEARHVYDYVILDLPPLGPVADALAIMPWTDGFMLVVEWGRTPRNLLRDTLEREPQLAREILGVVLNKVDLARLPRYSDPGGAERYVGTYHDYYQAPADGGR